MTCATRGGSVTREPLLLLGVHPVVAIIGDSTFLHSGVPALMGAAAEDTDLTVLILDNGTIAMTGTQETVLPADRLEAVVRAVGVDPTHVHVLDAHPHRVDEMARVMRGELEHRGLSVIVSTRECVEHAKRRRSEPAEVQR